MSKLKEKNEFTNIKLRLAELEHLMEDYNRSQQNNVRPLSIKDNLLADSSYILAQLHYAQEEIEKFYLEKESIRYEYEKYVEFSKQKISKLEVENQLLLSQLHIFQEELDKGSTISKNDDTEKLSYGAAERVKNELPYIIGSTVIKNSKSVSGIARLPIDLVKKIRDYDHQQLPDINRYLDADKATHIRNHLSYRIGKEIVDSIETPTKIVSLPTRLSKEILNFHSEKETKKNGEKETHLN